MDEESLIDEIKSKYILQHIFNYIEDKIFQLELFIHSKEYQNKLEINLIYKKKYLKGINLNKFLYQKEEDQIEYYHKYPFLQEYIKNNILTKTYNEFLLKNNFDVKKFENIVYEVKNKEEEYIIKEDYETKISIESPLFEVISKTKNFKNNYTIFISQKVIDKYNLKNYYRNFFNELNENNVQYFSIYYFFNDIKKLNYLEELNIDFNKIKRISFEFDGYFEINPKDFEETEKFYFSFNDLLFLDEIRKNLIYLKIELKKQINIPLIGIFNVFKSLNYLYLNGINLDYESIIKIENLKILSLNFCENFILSKKVNLNQLKELNLSKNNTCLEQLIGVKCKELEILNLKRNKNLYLEVLKEVNYKKLHILDISYNNLFNIEILRNVDFKELEILDLSNNSIKNIDTLAHVNFKKLKKLDLSNNLISEIKILENVEFIELEILELGCNNISYIYCLKNTNFKNLKELYLYNNQISNINGLEHTKFIYLEKLNLGNNNISDIDILKYVEFSNLKELKLYGNNISDIQVLEKVNFKELEILDLEKNDISDISVLEKVNFRKLKKLNLSINIISDIKILEKTNFERLEILDLGSICIYNINILDKVNFRRLKKLYLYNNNILFDTKILENEKFKNIDIYY